MRNQARIGKRATQTSPTAKQKMNAVMPVAGLPTTRTGHRVKKRYTVMQAKGSNSAPSKDNNQRRRGGRPIRKTTTNVSATVETMKGNQ